MFFAMKVRVVKRTQMVPRSIQDTFEFFSNPRVIETLTPSATRFRLVGEKLDSIKPGAILNYRFRFFRIPLRWRIRIESVDPPNSFVDVQLKGPFAHWKHSQMFIASGAKSTEVRDRFEFGLRFGRVGEFAYQLIVKAKIRQMFDYRANKMDMLMHANPTRPAKVQASPRQSPS
jgi:ligand-binding SRPBCC domain-containing protein